MKLKEIEYIKLHWIFSDRNKMIVEEHKLKNYLVLEIILCNPYGRDIEGCKSKWAKEIRKLKRRLRRYRIGACAVHMDTVMEQVFDKQGMAYRGRKCELLANRYQICGLLKGKDNPDRKKIVVYAGQGLLSFMELEQLFLAVKDYFEDITVCLKNQDETVLRLCDLLKGEWGVVVECLRPEEAERKTYDGAIAIIKQWSDSILQEIKCDNLFVLCEEELSTDKIFDVTDKRKFYAGFCYGYRGESMPYQMAVDYLYQKPENPKIQLTFIDICGLKCYNKP